VNDRHRHLAPLLRIALLVALGDYLTKAAAERFLAGDAAVYFDWLRLTLVHNHAGAFGWTMGAYTWQLNLALTLGAIVFVLKVSRDLAGFDRTAPCALGLIVGGAMGNFASLLLPPGGVVDFIALDFGAGAGLVLNLADLAAYAGLALILRTGFLIVSEMRRTTRPDVTPVLVRPLAPRLSLALAGREIAVVDREVALSVVRDDRAGDAERLTPMPSDVTPGSAPRLPLAADRAMPRPARVIEFPLHLVDPGVAGDGSLADIGQPPVDRRDTAR
jgi:lipoprotein signal peptidase